MLSIILVLYTWYSSNEALAHTGGSYIHIIGYHYTHNSVYSERAEAATPITEINANGGNKIVFI
jgi:hypothetical protein